MKRLDLAGLTLLLLSTTIASTTIASTTLTRSRAITSDTIAIDPNATLSTPLNTKVNAKPTGFAALDLDPTRTIERRPMALTVTLPSGEILKPIASNLTKSAQPKPNNSPTQLAQSLQTLLLDQVGELTDTDEVLASDNSYFDVYLVQGTANQTLTVSVTSNAFDTFLMLVDGEGNSIAQNNDISSSNSNSSLTTTLPRSDLYLVIVNGADSDSRGSYRVTASVSGGTAVAPTITDFNCNGYSSCTVTEGDADYMVFSYTDPNGNASEWMLNDFTAEIYPANGGGTIRPGIECACPTGIGDCNAPATDTYTLSMRDTSNLVSRSRSVTVTCAP